MGACMDWTGFMRSNHVPHSESDFYSTESELYASL
uniref:Uncharacterized protein n=1 Tax=Arundo donax TaxID=35708 RepID=A0A0A8YZJ8_ARUDO